MQKVMAQFNVPGMTAKQYDQVMNDLQHDGHKAPKGRQYHIAVQLPNGCMVTDIWDSAEALNQFAGILMPVLIKNGVTPPQPVIFPVYNDVKA